MKKVKGLRNYGAVKKGETIEVSPKQLDFLVRNGIVEVVDCGKDCEECEDCKSTKKKRSTTAKKKATKETMGDKVEADEPKSGDKK
jgi:hypothetical protein